MAYGDWSVYEWDVEEVRPDEEFGDEVVEHYFQNSFADCLKKINEPTEDGRRWGICIVLDTADRRSWAYMDMQSKTLPGFFEDAAGGRTRKVPRRFHKEVSKAQGATS
jgi:hypothetical protein